MLPYAVAEIAFPFDPGAVQLAYPQQVLADLPYGYWRVSDADAAPIASAPAAFAGAAADFGTPGTIAWTTPANAQGASNSTYATAAPGTSHYLYASTYGFAIPAAATITGIQVKINRRRGTGGTGVDNSVKLFKATGAVGTDKALAAAWPTSDTFQTYGGNGDLWGTTFTPAEVNVGPFGVGLSVTIGAGGGASVDAIQITVFYTLPDAPDISLYQQSVATFNGAYANITGPITGEPTRQAPQLDGVAGALTIANSATIDTLAAAWTVEAWVRPTAARAGANGTAIITRAYPGSGSIPFALGYGNPLSTTGAGPNVDSCAFLSFYTGTAWASPATDGVALTLNTWTHLVGSWDGVTLRLYKNGVQVGTSAPGVADVASSGQATYLGRRWDGSGATPFFPGGIAEAAIYTGPLSAARIAAHYAARTRPNPAADLASLPWFNVMRYIRQAGTLHGRQHELNRVETGTANLLANNNDRRFEPEYATSPYFPYVIPMRRVRLRAAFPSQLVPNGSFERSGASIAPWTATLAGAATEGIAAGDALANIGLANRVECASPAGAGADQAILTSDYIPIDTRKPYALSAYFWKTAAGVPYTIMRLACYDDNRNLLGRCIPSGAFGADGHFTLAGTAQWEKWGGVISGESAAASTTAFLTGTTYVKVEIYAFSNGSGGGPYTGTVRIDDVALTPSRALYADADYYRDGDYDANDAWEEVWNGYIENFGIQWTKDGRKSNITIPCVDVLEPLANGQPIGATMPAQLGGTRIQFALDGAGHPRSERSIMAGQFLMQLAPAGNALIPAAHIADVADSEVGIAFAGKDGKIVFQDHSDRITGGAHAISVSTFGDGPPAANELPYTDLTPDYGIEQVDNRVVVTRSGGNPQISEDAASQIQYWIRELDRTTLHTTDADSLAVGGILLTRYKQPSFRFDAIKTEGKRSPKLWPVILAREISDRVSVVRRVGPPGMADALVRAVHIESIAHTIDLQDTLHWETEYQLSPADTQAYWQLGTSALDTGTRLTL